MRSRCPKRSITPVPTRCSRTSRSSTCSSPCRGWGASRNRCAREARHRGEPSGPGARTSPDRRAEGRVQVTGDITVISGPTAVGKGTVVSVLRRRCPQVWVSVSATTRPPRPTGSAWRPLPLRVGRRVRRPGWLRRAPGVGRRARQAPLRHPAGSGDARGGGGSASHPRDRPAGRAAGAATRSGRPLRVSRAAELGGVGRPASSAAAPRPPSSRPGASRRRSRSWRQKRSSITRWSTPKWIAPSTNWYRYWACNEFHLRRRHILSIHTPKASRIPPSTTCSARSTRSTDWSCSRRSARVRSTRTTANWARVCSRTWGRSSRPASGEAADHRAARDRGRHARVHRDRSRGRGRCPRRLRGRPRLLVRFRRPGLGRCSREPHSPRRCWRHRRLQGMRVAAPVRRRRPRRHGGSHRQRPAVRRGCDVGHAVRQACAHRRLERRPRGAARPARQAGRPGGGRAGDGRPARACRHRSG